MELIACTCDGLPPHTHVPEKVRVRLPQGTTTLVDPRMVDVSPDYEIVERVPESIRIWVDWKAVARDLARAAR